MGNREKEWNQYVMMKELIQVKKYCEFKLNLSFSWECGRLAQHTHLGILPTYKWWASRHTR